MSGSVLHGVRGDLVSIDRAVYAAIARQETPTLDRPLRQLSKAGNWSALWIVLSGVMATVGGRSGRRAAGHGLMAIGISSAGVNLLAKRVSPRSRPNRDDFQHRSDRHVHMPDSSSFPSGHSASAFAFASAVGTELPWVALPLRGLATAVAYSRVHTGVHYPGDVVVGATIGTVAGESVARISRRVIGRSRQRNGKGR